MRNEYVRMTCTQKKQLKAFAEKQDISMNQFLIDSAFNIMNDKRNDSTLIETLKQQLDKKDEQIGNLQNIINQEQQLALKSSQQIEYLHLEMETNLKKEDKKKVFFSHLFNI